jgi:hypothetical protein
MTENEKAFPRSVSNSGQYGMTLRDYFAAKAMQGILSDPRNDDVRPSYVSEWAYKIADAMMKAREA